MDKSANLGQILEALSSKAGDYEYSMNKVGETKRYLGMHIAA